MLENPNVQPLYVHNKIVILISHTIERIINSYNNQILEMYQILNK